VGKDNSPVAGALEWPTEVWLGREGNTIAGSCAARVLSPPAKGVRFEPPAFGRPKRSNGRNRTRMPERLRGQGEGAVAAADERALAMRATAF
jgi:hypothetical protein